MTHSDLALIAVIGIAAVLVLGYLIGDFLPILAFLATGAFSIFVLPSFSGSPDACLNHHGTCAGHMTEVAWTVLGVPLIVAIIIKVARGDRRAARNKT
jgi:hypothetical protein